MLIFQDFADLLNGSFLFWNLRFTSFSIIFLGVNFSRIKTSFSFFAVLISTNQFTSYLLVCLVQLNSYEFSSDHSIQKHIALKSKKKFLLKIEGGAVLFLCWRHMLNFKSRDEPLRSSRSQMFFIMGALKKLAKLTRKRLCWSLFLIKLQP